MRKVVCHQFGPVESLTIVEAPDLEAGDGELVIDVEAAGANFVDGLVVQGRYQVKPPLPFTPGMEVAGTVRDTGERVLALCWYSGFASQVVAPAAAVFPLPSTLSATRAATLVQSYATMLYSLTRRTHVEPGDWVAVLGAGGGIGLAAVDIARALGARVVACASSDDKLAAAKRAGAEVTIAYGDDVDLKTALRDATGGAVDVVVDPVGGDKAEAALRALGWDGRYLVIGFASGTIPKIPANLVLLNNRAVIGVEWGAWTFRDPVGSRALVNDLLDMAGDGRLQPVEPTAYPLDEVVRCLTDLETRRVVGKAVLVP